MSKQKKEKKLKIVAPQKIGQVYEEYGIDYAIQNTFLAYAMAVVLPIAFGLIFNLNIWIILILILCTALLVPLFLIGQGKSKYEDRRLTDINSYLEQFIKGMITHKKIFGALKTVYEVFEDGTMKEAVLQAREHIANANDVTTAKQTALKSIENQYPCEQVKMVHDLCLRAELNGGDFTEELLLINSLRHKWFKRIKLYKAELNTVFRNTIILFITIIGICAFMLYSVPEFLSVKDNFFCQMAAVVLYFMFAFFARHMQTKTCVSLINLDKRMSVEEVEEVKIYLETYKKKKNKAFTGIGIFILIVTTIIAILLKSILLFAIGLTISVMFLNIERLIARSLKIRVKAEIEDAFPKWLFAMCLLVQKNNVPNAISKSLESAPPVLKNEINKLIAEIMENPASSKPYNNFLSVYEIETVRGAMKSIYSLKDANTSDKILQMQDLVRMIMEINDENDEKKQKGAITKLHIYYLMPMLPATFMAMVYGIFLFANGYEFMINAIR